MISERAAGPVARKILDHLGLPSEAPALGRARIEQGELFATGPPGDDSQVPPVENLDQRTDAGSALSSGVS